MSTKTTKYGTSYESPTGLQEDNYYGMMYELIDYIKEKGLTTRQAQKLFIDCSDMVLDITIDEDKNNTNIAKSLESIAYSLDYLVFNDKRSMDKSHSIPD